MSTTKRYFHDKTVLVLLSVNSFCVLLISALILLRLDSSKGAYYVQYRSSLGLVDRFEKGGVIEIISFVIFALCIFLLHLFLSLRVYHIRRNLSVSILALGLVLLVMAIVVSNALLLLR